MLRPWKMKCLASISLIAGVGLILVAFAVFESTSVPPSACSKEDVALIEYGMTEREVVAILGSHGNNELPRPWWQWGQWWNPPDPIDEGGDIKLTRRIGDIRFRGWNGNRGSIVVVFDRTDHAVGIAWGPP